MYRTIDLSNEMVANGALHWIPTKFAKMFSKQRPQCHALKLCVHEPIKEVVLYIKNISYVCCCFQGLMVHWSPQTK